MKKVIYIILFAFVAGSTITACTEEEVAPRTDLNGGGMASDPK
jgi:hypothetical protein